MKIIYRLTDLKNVGTVAPNMTTEQEVELNVIPNFGGEADDYDVIETDLKYFELVRESGVVKVIEKIPEVIIPEPTEIEELTNYVLDVDFRVVMLEIGL